jgi:ureidoglycolate dehydrogenase (NAD+)
MADRILIQAEPLRTFTREVFRKTGLPDEQATATADVLLWADLRGHASHGAWRIPLYTSWIDNGVIDVSARPKVVLRKGAVAKIDGGGAIGPAALAPAVDVAVEQARQHAAAWVLVQDHTHAGAIGFWAERVAAAGMAAIVMSALRPMMAYHGTRTATVSTNPIAIAMPGGLLLDMSTSTSSRGKIAVAKATGKPLPAGMALDREGRPTTDPDAAAILTPMAGPKGAGLSLMIECLTSVALGNPLISTALADPKLKEHVRQNSLVVAMDLSVLGGGDALAANLDAVKREIKAQPRAEGADEVLMPGERGAREQKRRLRDGISIPIKTWQQIMSTATKFGVSPPAEVRQ